MTRNAISPRFAISIFFIRRLQKYGNNRREKVYQKRISVVILELMQTRFLFLTILTLTVICSPAQNLVKNPGFEVIDSFRFYAADNWYAPSAGTTDFYNYPDDRVLSLFGGRTKAHNGKG